MNINIDLTIEELYVLNSILQNIKEYEEGNELNYKFKLYNNYTKRLFNKIEKIYNDNFDD